jgi:hypothetical protein
MANLVSWVELASENGFQKAQLPHVYSIESLSGSFLFV